MARTRMITRTITSTNAKILCCDVTTCETTIQSFTLTGEILDKEQILKIAKKEYETETLKLVAITETETSEELYGMLETDFLKYASKLNPGTRKID